jgi:hypothetical protein
MEDRSITFVPKRFNGNGRRLQPVLSGKYHYAGIYYNMVEVVIYIIVDLFTLLLIYLTTLFQL